MNRVQICQALIEKTKATSYIEIGVSVGECFKEIKCEHKVGVDPDPSSVATQHMTSDEFFEQNNEKFKICFVDGKHHAENAKRDILNCLECLEEGGFIVVHDCLPTTRYMQEIPLKDELDEWTGNVWESWVELRMTRPDILMHVVDTDHGCGVICKGSQELLKIDGPIDYDGFVKYRNHWMQVISVAQFQQKYLV